MYSCLVARIKGEDEYDFFTYTGPMIMLPFRGIEIPLSKGEKFGVRKSSNGKSIRLILGDDLNRVFTIDLETAKKIARSVGPA
jgi:hypothetical protein